MGRAPYSEIRDPVAVIARILSPAQRELPLPPQWPEALRVAINACWQQEPQRRPTAKDFVRRLTAAVRLCFHSFRPVLVASVVFVLTG
jgi:hypothetical protein